MHKGAMLEAWGGRFSALYWQRAKLCGCSLRSSDLKQKNLKLILLHPCWQNNDTKPNGGNICSFTTFSKSKRKKTFLLHPCWENNNTNPKDGNICTFSMFLDQLTSSLSVPFNLVSVLCVSPLVGVPFNSVTVCSVLCPGLCLPHLADPQVLERER